MKKNLERKIQMIEIKAFEADRVIRVQCETEEEFRYLVKGLQDKTHLLQLSHDLPVSPLASALLLLGHAKFEVPTGGDHDVWET